MDLDQLIALGLPARRRPASVVDTVAYVRDLGESDVPLLLNPPKMGIEAKPLVRMRNTHHMLARLVAEGRSNTEAALATGYATTRVQLLRNDPAFQELVSHYKAQADHKWVDVQERLAMLGLSTLDELQDRLESDPDGFKNRELMELAQMTLDRSVTKDPRRGGNGGPPPAVAITFVSNQPPAIEQQPVVTLDLDDLFPSVDEQR